VPKIRRDELILKCKKNKSYYEVTPEYSFTVKKEDVSMSNGRFDNLVGNHKVSPFFIASVEDVTIIGPYGLPFTRFGRLIVEPIYEDWLVTALLKTINTIGFFSFLLEYLKLFSFLGCKNKIAGFSAYLIPRASSVPYEVQYGHWILEQMPQFIAFKEYEDVQSIKLKYLVNRDMPAWQQEMLALSGLDYCDQLACERKSYKLERLVIATLRNAHSTNPEPDPRAVNRLNRFFLKISDGCNAQNTPKKVFIDRQMEANRRLSNFQSINKQLADLNFVNFKTLVYGQVEEICYFRNCEYLLTTVGSALCKILFSKSIKKVLEIYPESFKATEIFFYVSWSVGAKHISIPSKTVKYTPDGKDFLISINRKDLDKYCNLC